MTVKLDFKNLTLQDALDLAILIEEEARERYLEFAEGVGTRYENDAGDFFKVMAENEAKHRDQLTARRKKLFKDAPRRVDPNMIWDVEAPAEGEGRTYLSPRQAAHIALNAEQKAYDFFNEALKHAQNKEVKELFTELRDEEAQHSESLKQLMKRLPEGENPDRDDDDMDEPPALG